MNEYTKISNSVDDKAPPTVRKLHLLQIYAVRRCVTAPRRYPYFDVVVGLVWSRDPKSYASGSVCYW
jgi:hypothetical protein